MDLYFLKYNNYFNRTYKKEKQLISYLDYEVGRVEDCELWNPNDGVYTEQDLEYEYEMGKVFPDYMIAAVGSEIESRWFVLDGKRLSNGMYHMSLRRDIIADEIDKILESPMYIQRALLPENNTLIYNGENISVNQIKTKETLIKDNSGVAWIVGYLNRSVQSKEITGALDIEPNATYDSLSAWTDYQYATNWFNGYTADSNNWFTLYWSKVNANPLAPDWWVRSWDIKLGYIKQNSDSQKRIRLGWVHTPSDSFPSTNLVTDAFTQSTSWIDDIRTNFGIKSEIDTQNFTGLDDSIVYIKNINTYYKVRLISESITYEETLNSTEAKTEATQIYNICSNVLGGNLNNTAGQEPVYTFHSSGTRYKLQLEEISTEKGFKYTIPASRPHLDDAPYDMFAIPYGTYSGLGDKTIALKAANAAIAEFNVNAGSELYDVQLLPFQPSLSSTTITDIKNSSDKVIGKIYWATSSTFSKTILLNEPIGVENKKIDHICNKYRLVSPNYNGQFEFTAAANNGISGVKVDATYLPLNPYIRVAPLFGGLYGREFEDARGLICGGDFSLPVVNSAWVSYQQSNKYYQAIFDRQVSNLEFNNRINRTMQGVGAAAGTIQGAVSGATAGSTFGPYGAAAGAVVGFGASFAGGVADLNLNEQLRQEQLRYNSDIHDLNIATIQAQPYSLSKTTAFTANNKIFPILEYYTCSNEEKDLVATHIINYSMTVGAIGKLKDYIKNTWQYNGIYARNFIKGTFLKLKDLFEDYHYLNALNEELNIGVYFDEYTE